jgi:hypothetical protein
MSALPISEVGDISFDRPKDVFQTLGLVSYNDQMIRTLIRGDGRATA